MFMTIATEIIIVLCGIVSIIYGYRRWSYSHDSKERWWYVIGLLLFADVFWDYISTIFLLSIDPQILFWSRNLISALVVIACVVIYKRYELE